MGLYKDFVNQTRKPEGKLGKMMLNGMNSGHAKMADWGMSHLNISVPERVIDLGCGGGRNIGELLNRYPQANGMAVDYSDLSVAKAVEYNNNLVSNGRLTIKQGNVRALDINDNSFDLATAFETVYFWPGIEDCFKEVARILKPGGVFMIVNESDGTDKTSLKYEKIIDGMRCYTIEQLTNAMKSAGFTAINSYHHDNKPWIAVIGVK